MTRASKIVPSPIPAWCIPRASIEERLGEAVRHRITTVTAGAGFGKSTALARWAPEVRGAWYTLGPEDMTLGTLTGGLMAALGLRVPDLPADLSTPAGQALLTSREEHARAEALAAHLAEWLDERLRDDLILVLDDLQELHAGSPAVRFVETLCRTTPGLLHLVLASRAEPPFPLARLRARGQVLTIDAAALTFSRAEVEALLQATLGSGTSELAGPVHELTGGWPAAVRLAAEAMRSVPPGRFAEVLAGLRRPGGALFTYLAEEVLAREPERARTLLRQVSEFDWFTMELCAAVGMRGTPETLAGLLRTGLFVQPAGGEPGTYTVHALVREFVREHLPLAESRRRALHRRAAVWFESQGEVEQAMRSHAAASDARAIARLIKERGADLIARGAAESVLALAGTLPIEVRDSGVEEVVGEALVFRGDLELALECFRRAAANGGDLPPSLAWRMGWIHLSRGEREAALRVYKRARLDGSRPRDEAQLFVSMASACLLQGDAEACRRFANQALRAAEAAGAWSAAAGAHGMLMTEAMGNDPAAADAHFRLALEAADRANDVVTSATVRRNRASQLNEEGRYEEALQEIEISLRQAELAGSPAGRAHSLLNRGEVRAHLGRLDEAIPDLKAARDLYHRSGSLKACWAVLDLAAVYRKRGDLALARTTLDEGAALAEQSRDVQGLASARQNLALLVALEAPEEASRLAAEAVAAVRSWGLGLAQALVSAGWVALARGERDEAAALGTEAADEARSVRQRPALAEALEVQALAASDLNRQRTLLEQAAAVWREIDNPLGWARVELALARFSPGPAARALALAAERRLLAMGVRPRAAARAAGLLAFLPDDDSPSLEILTLGGFRVIRDGQAVPETEWKSKKARDLLKILLARRGRPTRREVIWEVLWPEEAPDGLAKRLSAALSVTRAVLDPQHRFPPDHFVAADPSAVWLDSSHVPVDVNTFLAESAAGFALLRQERLTEAREVLASAEAGYTGDFLEEDLYQDWAAPLREEARATYISVARELARAAVGVADPDAAVRYYLRILQRDAYDEEAHLGLVSALAGAGRHGEARRSYRTYVSRMEELGVEPAAFPRAA